MTLRLTMMGILGVAVTACSSGGQGDVGDAGPNDVGASDVAADAPSADGGDDASCLPRADAGAAGCRTANDRACGPVGEGPVVEMQAVGGCEQPLPSSVPLTFTMAYGLANPATNIPFVHKHEGSTSIRFDAQTGVDAASLVGALVATGYTARTRYQVGALVDGQCTYDPARFTPFVVYDPPYGDRSLGKPLALGGANAGNPPCPGHAGDFCGVEPAFPRLTAGQCLLLQWMVTPIPDYKGNAAHLSEELSIARNNYDTLPATKTISGQAPTSGGGGISLDVSEPYGAVGKELKIWTGTSSPISILHNLGAPTDDGMVWGIAMADATGLYGVHDAPTNLGSSQFVGHADVGSLLGAAMWGLRMPLDQSGQALTTAASCGGPCFVPMYSDWTSAETFGSTFPFFLPRSVHPWDAQVSTIAIANVKTATGAASPIEELTYAFRFRAHLPFTAAQAKPGLWFDQALTDTSAPGEPARPMNVYLVYADGTSTSLPDSATRQWDGAGGTTETDWQSFCQDGRARHCGSNPNHLGDVTCICSFEAGKGKSVIRVIFDYYANGVALALHGTSNGFANIVLSALFNENVKGRPGFLVSAANRQWTTTTSFDPHDPLIDDGYIFSVATLAELDAAGRGRR